MSSYFLLVSHIMQRDLILFCRDIKERDTSTGKVKYSWSINSVLSCVLGRSNPPTVDIIFDTTRKDREKRRYFAESEDAKVPKKYVYKCDLHNMQYDIIFRESWQ